MAIRSWSETSVCITDYCPLTQESHMGQVVHAATCRVGLGLGAEKKLAMILSNIVVRSAGTGHCVYIYL